MMLLAVSLEQSGRVLAVQEPKNESISAATVDFREPVFPTRAVTVFDSQCVALIK